MLWIAAMQMLLKLYSRQEKNLLSVGTECQILY